ncbi:oxidoreductase NAD-binding domain-containing protein 1 [Triangularia setosa]|uniref:Oxidoreductase NAD-binding domain-containing protein 1 n=1 Tax=Triangularia setosa TaxID=2587417 RepID=A0AAN6WCT4_9PEZI|nr:oxidoreductase NAD-binding domain-containing protein 1 [Podospora setosa]
MTTTKTKTTHIDRTAHEPRDNSLHELLITSITPISPTIRIVRLSPSQPQPQPSIHFFPGQWLDLYHPPFPPSQKPGGFTITSPPSALPYLELAIQSSPTNPPAAYLWQEPPSSLLNTTVRVRIGGSFIYPPLQSSSLLPFKKVLFVAGGLGINPIMSMLSHIATLPPSERRAKEVAVLYGMKDPNGKIQAGDTSQALFLDRIAGLFAGDEDGLKGTVKLFLTGSGQEEHTESLDSEKVIQSAQGVQLPLVKRRMALPDLAGVIGEEKDEVAVYICGVPSMTDELVEELTSPSPKGLCLNERRVLHEKWW